MKKYIFIVDTEQYSGNFERKMGAAMTGMVGEYFPSKVKKYTKLPPACSDEFADGLQDKLGLAGRHNDYNAESYVSIWPTPGWFNDGNGVEYRAADKKAASLEKFPAYLSVAIFFDEKPNAKEIEFMKKRAREFEKVYGKEFAEKNIFITGFRMVTESIAQTEEVT